MSEPNKPVAVVAGAGPGTGAALARRFARAGYRLALLSRRLATTQPLLAEIPDALPIACDLGHAPSVEAAFQRIRSEMGPVDTLLYNAGSGVFANIEATTPEHFEQSWRVNAFGAFVSAQQVIPWMKQKAKGNIVLIGATASRRGGPRTSAFAPAKAAQRSLAEALARSLWPLGIHVGLIIVDGVIDSPEARAAWSRPPSFFVDPAGIAETAFQLTEQSPQAWSFEVEARPFRENW